MTALLGYQANYSASIESIEQVSSLTSEGIYYQINSIFSKPYKEHTEGSVQG